MKPTTAIKIQLGLLIAAILFHASIVVKIIPYDITWGGRLQNDQEMYAFEAVSIFINLFMGFVLLIRGGFIRAVLPPKVVTLILWIFLILFVLNTVGNLLAETNFEKLFSLMTATSAFLFWIILMKDQRHVRK